ncbi:ANTAR domain-containing protein [Terrabacter sp. NPDC000476]|uniref:ANTAR domain-containing protein n=1 Tax=Terrabacter sp. NPDC000476 TaxID=3154258 RepID=UPI00332562F2
MPNKMLPVHLTPEAVDAALVRQALEMSRDKVAQLEQALQTSRQIGAAVGVIMALHRVTYDEAYLLIRCTSQQSNVKVRQVALDVLEQGCLPEYPRRRG